ncbi:MAG: membrane lipoprotein lipid attachment site-containing protein [Bacilli bacterium]|nr:membrane lipoprotein lipid attachment site-containing protein [Bacilli bacterium]
MKKIIVLLSIVVLFLSGCSAYRLDSTDLGNNIKVLLSEKVDIYNVYFDGYKYYVPKGIKLLNKDEYNATFMDKSDNKYYLYVDAISYYHKTENTYMVDEKIHYSNKLEYNGKTGYINIEKIEDKYFIQFMFNYAKMEAYVPEEDLTTVVNNMCFVLRTVKFNDDVLESLIGDNVLSYQEENFTLFDTESSNEDFLEVVQDGGSTSEKSDFKSDEEIELDGDY